MRKASRLIGRLLNVPQTLVVTIDRSGEVIGTAWTNDVDMQDETFTLLDAVLDTILGLENDQNALFDAIARFKQTEVMHRDET